MEEAPIWDKGEGKVADAEWRASWREGNGRTAACTRGTEGKLSRKSAATADQRTIELRDEEHMSIRTKAESAMTCCR